MSFASLARAQSRHAVELSKTESLSFQRSGRAFNSDVSLLLHHPQKAEAEKALAEAMETIRKLESIASLYLPDSDIVRLNREGALDKPHPWLVKLLQKAQATSERSGGAFDVTVQPLWESYWSAKKAGRLPADAEIERARQKVNWRNIAVSPERVRFKEPGMAITLNALVQGYAADRVIGVLRKHGIRRALVSTGEIGALGRKPNGEPWTIGIQHPRHKDAYIALAKVEDCFLATSGDYEADFSDDHAYHHIFDPATGRSPKDFSSVTVLAPTGVDADALATAAFAMGLEQGLKLIRSVAGAKAFLVLKDGRTLATGDFPLAAPPSGGKGVDSAERAGR